MVKAIILGRKTQTRRKLKTKFPQEEKCKRFELFEAEYQVGALFISPCSISEFVQCPYGVIGDMLWVKETYQFIDFLGDASGYVYKASENGQDWAENSEEWKWKPSLFMPKTAARVWLQISNIRVERLHDITQEDAKAEGIKYSMSPIGFCGFSYKHGGYNRMTTAKTSFLTLWESINGDNSWEQNPWVWVLDFKVISTNGRPQQEAYLSTQNNQ